MGIEAYCDYHESKMNPIPSKDPFRRPMPSMEEIERQLRNAILGRTSGIHLIEEPMRDELLAQFNPQLKLVK